MGEADDTGEGGTMISPRFQEGSKVGTRAWVQG